MDFIKPTAYRQFDIYHLQIISVFRKIYFFELC